MVQTYEILDRVHTDMNMDVPTVFPRGRFIESNHIIGLQRAFSRAAILVVRRTVYGIRIRKAAVHETFLSEAFITSSDRFFRIDIMSIFTLVAVTLHTGIPDVPVELSTDMSSQQILRQPNSTYEGAISVFCDIVSLIQE